MRITLVCGRRSAAHGHEEAEADAHVRPVSREQSLRFPVAPQFSVPFQSGARLPRLGRRRGIPLFVKATQPRRISASALSVHGTIHNDSFFKLPIVSPEKYGVRDA